MPARRSSVAGVVTVDSAGELVFTAAENFNGTVAFDFTVTDGEDESNSQSVSFNIGAVNGSIYCAPPAPGTTTTLAIATQARADAQTAYNELAALPPGVSVFHVEPLQVPGLEADRCLVWLKKGPAVP